MKLSTLPLLFCISTTSAFIAPTGKVSVALTSASLRHMTNSAEEEIAALKAAAAKAREDAARLSAELGKVIPNNVVATSKKRSVSSEDIASKTAQIDFEGGDAVSQIMQLDELAASGDLAFWKKAKNDAMLRTFSVSLGFLESRTGGKVNGESLGLMGDREVSLDDFKYALLGVTVACSVLGVAALAFLPENVGATVCYLVALIPILFVGVGSTAPALIANVIATTKGTAEDKEMKLERICRHESAHFLCGYLVGLPVKSYSVLDNGIPSVEFHLSSEGDATSREFSSEEVAALSVVAMSGAVGEILEFGSAKGGENDLIELERVFTRSKEFMGAQKQQDLTRWGALTSFQLITQNKEKYDALVEAFRNKKSVSECVAIVESR